MATCCYCENEYARPDGHGGCDNCGRILPYNETARAGRTAIARNGPSLPMRWLDAQYRLIGRCLDYGCGRGVDADTFRMNRYDPNHAPDMPPGTFDTITCNYVLDVVPPNVADDILADIRSRLSPGGRAYVTVRRDVTRDGAASKGAYQRNVVLNLPVVREVAGYCMYVIAAPGYGLGTH